MTKSTIVEKLAVEYMPNKNLQLVFFQTVGTVMEAVQNEAQEIGESSFQAPAKE